MDTLFKVFDFLIFTVFVKYVIARWVSERIVKLGGWAFNKFFVKTKRESAILVHSFNKSLNKNHNHDNMCDDENCPINWPLKT